MVRTNPKNISRYWWDFIPPLLVLVKLRQRGGPPPAFQMPFPSVLLPLAFAMSLVLLVSSGVTGLLGGLAWLGIGLALRWARQSMPQHGGQVR